MSDAELRKYWDNLPPEGRNEFPGGYSEFKQVYEGQFQAAPPPEESFRPADLAPTAVRVAGPLVGGVLGTLAAPGPGTYGGLATGGALAELLAQKLENRPEYSFTEAALGGTLAAVPVPGLGPTTATMLRQAPVRAMAREASRGAIESGVAGQALRWLRGEPTRPSDVATDVGAGAALGGGITGLAAGAQRALSPLFRPAAEWMYRGMFPSAPDTAERITQATSRSGVASPADLPFSEARGAAQRQIPTGLAPRSAQMQQTVAQQLQNEIGAAEPILQLHLAAQPPLPLSRTQQNSIRAALDKIITYSRGIRSEESAQTIREARTLQRTLGNTLDQRAALQAKRFLDSFNSSKIAKSPQDFESATVAQLRDAANLLRRGLHQDALTSDLLRVQEEGYALQEALTRGMTRAGETTGINQFLLEGPTGRRLRAMVGRRLQALTGDPIPSFQTPTIRNAVTQNYVNRMLQTPPALPPATAISAGPATPPPSGRTSGGPLPDISAYYTTTPQRTGRLLGPATAEFPAGLPPTLEEGVSAVVPAAIVDEIPQNARRQTQGLREGNPLLPIFGGESALRSVGVQGVTPTAATVGGGGTIRLTPAQARTQLTAVTEALKTSKTLAPAERDTLRALAKDLKQFLKETR